MLQQDITSQLTDYILNELASRAPESRPGADFPIIEAGLVDSLGLFKLISFIEEKYAVKIAPDEILFENFATIGAITALIQSKLK